jgi:hypothetical protein
LKGIKYDQGKPRYELLPVEPIEELVKILTHGAIKYEDNNWRYVEPFQDRYYGAAFRHLQKWRLGKIVDEDSGFHHLGSALCCILFLLCRDLENETEEEKKERETIQQIINEKYLKLKESKNKE